jgi:hypothetical protein
MLLAKNLPWQREAGLAEVAAHVGHSFASTLAAFTPDVGLPLPLYALEQTVSLRQQRTRAFPARAHVAREDGSSRPHDWFSAASRRVLLSRYRKLIIRQTISHWLNKSHAAALRSSPCRELHPSMRLDEHTGYCASLLQL